MELKIGENIKRLRRDKGMTQEQLAELLNISCAAVSKWESCDTYPDITMIFPLAHLFEVSVDELMGYDAARTEVEIEGIISDYQQLQFNGRFKKATEILCKARKEYPNDYRIMHIYMWDLAGGSADNDPAVLTKHYDEFMQICDCILGGCTNEQIRLETLTMKAKLLYVKGGTPGALELLRNFPTWYQSSGQKIEQLFAKDTPEFRYWVRKNLYELADFAADKAVKVIFFDDNLTLNEKISKVESLGNMFTELSDKSGEAIFAIIEKSLFGRLANDLTFRGGNEKDIIRVRDKQLQAVKTVTKLSKNDVALSDVFKNAHNTDDLLKWTVDYFKTNESEPLARFRKNPEYMSMLDKYSNNK